MKKEKQSKIRIHYPVTDWSIFLNECKDYFEKSTKGFPRKKHTDPKRTLNPVDFQFIKPIGIGTFCTVYLTKLKYNNDLYAIKVLKKSVLIDSKTTTYVGRHRKYLEGIMFPFCLGITCTFQDTGFLFICQPLVVGGDLYFQLNKNKKFLEEVVLFYGAQIILAIEYLHHLGIVHRNIKPENILLDGRGYLKLTGFTYVKKINEKTTYTYCGTPEYMAPEMVLQMGHTKEVDWWSLGVLLYELVTGVTPFKADDTVDMYNMLLKGEYTVRYDFSFGFEEVIVGLLKVDPLERLGRRQKGGASEVKDMRWFQDLDWVSLINQEIVPLFVPSDDFNFPELEPVDIIPPEINISSAAFNGF